MAPAAYPLVLFWVEPCLALDLALPLQALVARGLEDVALQVHMSLEALHTLRTLHTQSQTQT